MKKVVAVIVTYNRLNLLKEAISSVKNQDYPILNIIVVNNGSNDETGQWLAQQQDLNIESLKVNTGASGGFHHGIKTAVSFNADWIWVLDDDTLCNSNALRILLQYVDVISEPVGFVGSKCIWTDGKPHLMNVPLIKALFQNSKPYNLYDQFGVLLVESNSWVSTILNVDAVKAVGLPYKDFHHWSDDLEYTQRITKKGFLGLYAINSVVTHKTALNYCPDFYGETLANLWKYRVGFRNEFFLKKKQKGYFYYLCWLFAKVGYTAYKVIKIRKDNRIKFLTTLLTSAWESLFFNPQIDKV